MTARQETKFNMYNTVIAHCLANAAIVAGIPAACSASLIAFVASLSDSFGARLNENVTAGNWP